MLANPLFAIDDLLDLADKPGIDAAGIVDLLLVEAESERLRHLEQPVRGGRAERGADHVLVVTLTEPL